VVDGPKQGGTPPESLAPNEGEFGGYSGSGVVSTVATGAARWLPSRSCQHQPPGQGGRHASAGPGVVSDQL